MSIIRDKIHAKRYRLSGPLTTYYSTIFKLFPTASTFPDFISVLLTVLLHDPLPNLLHNVPGRRFIVRIRLDLCQPRHKVHLVGAHKFGLCDDFVADPEHREAPYREVVGDEVANRPITSEEDGPSAEEENDRDSDDGVPGGESPFVHDGGIRQLGSADALASHTLVEADVDEADAPPRHETGGSGEIGEVAEDLAGGRLERHECEQTEERAEPNSDVRQTVASGTSEKLGRLTVDGKTEEGTARGEQVRRGGRPSRCQETGVDDGRQSGDTGLANGNDEGRSEGVTRVELQARRVGGNKDTDDKGTAEVEDEDANIDTLDGAGQVAARVLGFTGSNGDDLGTDVGEGGLGESGPETEELAEGTLNTGILDESVNQYMSAAAS